jgi:RNA polymerase sigma-70 factor (ECF subfamily)
MDELLAKVKNGDRRAEQQIFQILLVRFELLAKRRVRNEDSARDIAQDACTTVLEKYKTEEFTTGFEAWAYGVLRMKIGNHIQKMNAEREKMSIKFDIELAPGPSAHIDSDLKMRLLVCLKEILEVNSKYARVLNLTYQGYKTDEICQRLGILAGNFYVTLNRGRSLLRHCLEKGEV